MGGGGTETTTTRSGSEQINQAVDTLGSKLNTALNTGYKPFTGSLVPDMSNPTSSAINALSANPNNSVFSGGVSGALGQQAQIAQGNFGADPVRSRLIDDTATSVNAVLQGSGRFGSGSHKGALIDEVGGKLANYDYGRQQQAIGNLGSLYSMSTMPAAANLQAGQLLDTYGAAKAAEAARQFDATQNAPWATLDRAGGVIAGTSGAAGQSTTSPTAPWWQQALGAGAIGSGIYKNIWGT